MKPDMKPTKRKVFTIEHAIKAYKLKIHVYRLEPGTLTCHGVKILSTATYPLKPGEIGDFTHVEYYRGQFFNLGPTRTRSFLHADEIEHYL